MCKKNNLYTLMLAYDACKNQKQMFLAVPNVWAYSGLETAGIAQIIVWFGDIFSDPVNCF